MVGDDGPDDGPEAEHEPEAASEAEPEVDPEPTEEPAAEFVSFPEEPEAQPEPTTLPAQAEPSEAQSGSAEAETSVHIESPEEHGGDGHDVERPRDSKPAGQAEPAQVIVMSEEKGEEYERGF